MSDSQIALQILGDIRAMVQLIAFIVVARFVWFIFDRLGSK